MFLNCNKSNHRVKVQSVRSVILDRFTNSSILLDLKFLKAQKSVRFKSFDENINGNFIFCNTD